MTIRETYSQFLTALKKIYDEGEAENITNIVFETITGISKTHLLTNPAEIISTEAAAALQNALDQLLLHKPMQYVLGETWFYKLKFKVSPAVLIPRPETEELVFEVIQFSKENKVESLLDIGTGSGCIAITIKKNCPAIETTAIDVSDEALEIATENANANNTVINFKNINFLEESTWNDLDKFDVIVSNPPYIPLAEKMAMDKNVTDYEPHTALFVADKRPLIFYEKIAAFGKIKLNRSGKIFLETHENLAREVAHLFEANGYTAIIKKDISGKERMVMATHCL